MGDAKVKSAYRQAADDLAAEEAASQAASKAYAGPVVTDYGYEAGGNVQTKMSPSAKFAQEEARMSPEEKASLWAQRHAMRTKKQ